MSGAAPQAGVHEPSEPEQRALARAVELAARGLMTVSPNPVVGCVVLGADGAAVGEGWHERSGGPHAEVVALGVAGERARGGTAVVTLEPCSHTGRTGPCTAALRDAGVARVVFAVADPTPDAAGGGQVLRDAGIEVLSGDGAAWADGAERVNERWLTAVRCGRPHTTWKYAATLDGRSAAPDGSSRWITGPDARAEVHRMRALADAVLVGVGTVLADDPSLTVRGPGGEPALPPHQQPLRVVADTHGRTPAGARVRDDAAPAWVATAAELGSQDGRLDLHALMAALAARGVRSVLTEGGPVLAAALLRAGLVDRVTAYLAPALLGGDGRGALGALGIVSMGGIVRLDLDDVARVGGDVRISSRVHGRRNNDAPDSAAPSG